MTNVISPTKKMLFLDDRTKRIEYALSHFTKDYEVTIVTNPLECLRYLSREDFDIVSLDHDLDGCDFQDPDSVNSGMQVVRYLEKTGWPPNKPKPIFHIHSSNLFAAYAMSTRMLAIGLSAYYYPIVYPENHMKYDKDGIPIKEKVA